MKCEQKGKKKAVMTELPADVITYEKESGDFGVSFHCAPQCVLESP